MTYRTGIPLVVAIILLPALWKYAVIVADWIVLLYNFLIT